jgi:Mn2+/Fe2+ NRAMP family transporter
MRILRAVKDERVCLLTRTSVAVKLFVVAPIVAMAAAVEASAGLATESSAETAVKTLAEKIGSEGIAIFLICITAITALLAVIVGVNLGIKKLKSFAK